MGSFRLMSYNVRSGGSPEAASLTRACAADVVCVQEASRSLRWRSRRARMARESGLVTITHGHASGAALLGSLRTQVVHEESVALSWIRGLPHRGLACAVLDLASGGRVLVASVHLDLEAAARRAHVLEVLDHLDRVRMRYPAPVVLAGDINEGPAGSAWNLLAERFRDAYLVSPRGDGLTFPAHRPRHRIDAVFVDSGIDVAGCGVPNGKVGWTGAPRWWLASDHRPVLADLEVPRPATQEKLGK